MRGVVVEAGLMDRQAKSMPASMSRDERLECQLQEELAAAEERREVVSGELRELDRVVSMCRAGLERAHLEQGSGEAAPEASPY
jgi:hypothetical protein